MARGTKVGRGFGTLLGLLHDEDADDVDCEEDVDNDIGDYRHDDDDDNRENHDGNSM